MPTNTDNLKRLALALRERTVTRDAEDSARREQRKAEDAALLTELDGAIAAQGESGPVEPPPGDPPPVEPPPVTPTEPPKPPADDDVPPYPALPAFIATPGADLAKLTQDATLPPGDYTTSGDVKVNVVAQKPGTVTLKLKAKQTPQLPDVFAGVDVVGGGLPDNDDVSKAGTKAGALVHSCTFSDSEGFGLLVTRGGKTRVHGCVIADNGSGGIGGTGKTVDMLITDCAIHRNNVKWKRKNSNKFTRGKVEFRGCDFNGNAGVDVWADNYVQSLTVTDCTFAGTLPDKSGKRWTAANVKGEISDRLIVTGCTFTNDVTAAVSVDEMKDETRIEGNTFRGDADASIELRDLARDGYSLSNVTIRGNRFESPKAAIVPSGAGNKVTLSKNRIVIEGNTGTVDVKIPK